MSLIWILIIALLLFSVIGAPSVGLWHHNYGYYPSGLGVILVIVLVVWLLRGGTL